MGEKGTIFMNNFIKQDNKSHVAMPTIYVWYEMVKLPCIKCGRLLRFDLDDVIKPLMEV